MKEKKHGINMQETAKEGASEKNCTDRHCPIHGALSLRGRVFEGQITKANIHKTATVEWQRLFYIPKYERYEKRRTRLKVHIPDCLSVRIGDAVKITECRPISKTKYFVITEVKQK